jgi:hypothetical protein
MHVSMSLHLRKAFTLVAVEIEIHWSRPFDLMTIILLSFRSQDRSMVQSKDLSGVEVALEITSIYHDHRTRSPCLVVFQPSFV